MIRQVDIFFLLWMVKERRKRDTMRNKKEYTIDVYGRVFGRETNKADTMRVDSVCMYVLYIIAGHIYSRTCIIIIQKWKSGWANCLFLRNEMWRSRFEKRGVGAQTRHCQCHCNQGRPLLSVMILISHLCSSPVVTSTKKNWRRPKTIGKISSLFVLKQPPPWSLIARPATSVGMFLRFSIIFEWWVFFLFFFYSLSLYTTTRLTRVS